MVSKFIHNFIVELGKLDLADKKHKSNWQFWCVEIVAIGAVYFLLAWLARTISFGESSVSPPIWPAAGFALAIVLLRGNHVWPGIWLGCFAYRCVFLSMAQSEPTIVSFVIAAGATIQATLGAILVHDHCTKNRPLSGTSDAFCFVATQAVACLLGATIAIVGLYIAGILEWAIVLRSWTNWYFADVIGAIIVGPTILAVQHSRMENESEGISTDSVLRFAACLLVALVVFSSYSPFAEQTPNAFFILPFVLWAAIRVDQLSITILILLVSAIAVWGTSQNVGPFSSNDPNASPFMIQSFLALLAVSTLVIHGQTQEHANAQRAYREIRDDLQQEFEDSKRDHESKINELASVLESASSLVGISTWDWDLKRDFAACSKNHFSLFGQPPKDHILKEEFFDLIHPKDRDGIRSQLDAALKNTSPYDCQFRVIWPDGQVRWLMGKAKVFFNSQGNPIRMVGVNMDITGQKKTENELQNLNEELEKRFAQRTEKLRETEQRMSLAVQATGDAIWDFDLVEGVVWRNEHYAAMFGEDAPTMSDSRQWWIDHIHPDDRDQTVAIFQNAINEDVEHVAHEYRFRRVDGTYAYIFERAFIARDKDGQATRIVGAMHDFSERRRLENQLVELSTQERRLIGHQLHDDLGQILAGLTYLAANVSDDASDGVAVDPAVAEKLVLGLENATGNLREITKGVHPVQIDADGLSHALSELVIQTSEHYAGQCTFECTGESSVGDNHIATQLFYIAQEALRNAVHHANGENVGVRLEQQADHLLVEVTDDGQGIEDPNQLPEGLGMEIMRYRASVIGASLDIQSNAGDGTVVQCRIGWNAVNPDSRIRNSQ